jgi:acetylornithine deacetylase/succinyl-diaminopimelate desuccinylase-like protein
MQSISKDLEKLSEDFSILKIEKLWIEKVKATLDEYMAIPNVSPAFDSNWKTNGHIDNVISLFEKFAKQNAPVNATVKVQEIENRTPLLVVDVPARNYDGDDVVLIYGHSDKQPPMKNWRDGIEPFAANYIGDRLYGRGGADDGYAIFSALLAMSYLEENDITHARFVLVIEASEESGSPDLPAHLEVLDSSLAKPLGEVSLVVCLDSGCLDYEHLWITQSLRGLLQVNLEVKVLDQGTHSGGAGGIVPSAFHILRELLDRIAEPGTGELKLKELHMDIPKFVKAGASNTAEILGTVQAHGLPFADGVKPLKEEVRDQLISNTYRPALEIIGIEGLPDIQNAGNVLRDKIEVALSFRLPPEVDPQTAANAVIEELKKNPPFDAQVRVETDSLASGWAAPQSQDWLNHAFRVSSNMYFGNTHQVMGEGGTIPFMAMLGQKYPKSQFMVTGVLGPESNAHGPNEFLDLPTAYKVTGALAGVLQSHGRRENG